MQKQNALSIWLIGLPAAGKTTIANELIKKLSALGVANQQLDGDIVRVGINKDLGFSIKDRNENIRRIAEISKLFIKNNISTVNSFICPTQENRNIACQIIGKENFFLVYINTPLEICEQRDPKGLYKKARNGEIQNFTGIDSNFEIPENQNLTIDTTTFSIEESVQIILSKVLPIIQSE